MKVVKNTDETPGAAGVDSPSLTELLANKAEYDSVKQQAFLELKRFSRQLRGVMLLCDDLAGLASIDEAATKVRRDHDALVVERNAIAADVAKLRTTSTDLRTRNAELTEQVEQATTRVEQLETAERSLAAALQQYNTAVGRQDEIAAAIEQAERSLAGLRAEETRLAPIVRAHEDVERKLPQAQERLAAIEQKLAQIRSSI
jgi:chromosome segregation ATPase